MSPQTHRINVNRHHGSIIALAAFMLVSTSIARADTNDCPAYSNQFKSVQLRQTPSIPQPIWACMAAPTNLQYTQIRTDGGLFHGSRQSGTPHQGIDITIKNNAGNNTCAPAGFAAREVYAIAAGRVAYARLNAPEACPKNMKCPPDRYLPATTGYGLTVIIDHGNGIYSMYAHLAADPAELKCQPLANARNGKMMMVHKGEQVQAGQLIGHIGEYDGDIWDRPTGNAAATSSPRQVHFELFAAPVGLTSDDAISKIVAVENRGEIDPAMYLRQFKEYGLPAAPKETTTFSPPSAPKLEIYRK